MKKNLLLSLLALAVAATFIFPSLGFAEGDNTQQYYNFVVDNYESIEAENLKELNDLANQIYQNYNVAIFYVVTANTGEIDADKYAENYFYENSPCSDGFILVDNTGTDFGRHVFAAGRCKNLLGTRWQAIDHNYLLEPTFYKGAKTFYTDCMSVLKAIDINTVQVENKSDTQATARLYDQAKLLSDKEAEKLLSDLDTVSESRNFDILVLTVESVSESSPTAYAKKYYNQNNYGKNDSKDGIILLYVADTKQQWIYTFGKSADVYTADGVDYITSELAPSLEKGKYKDAFNRFVELAGTFEEQAATGEAFDGENVPEATVKPPKTSGQTNPLASLKLPINSSVIWIVVAALLGMGVILFIISNMKRQRVEIYDKKATKNYSYFEEDDIDF